MPKCNATTKTGKKCKRRACLDEKVCRQHSTTDKFSVANLFIKDEVKFTLNFDPTLNENLAIESMKHMKLMYKPNVKFSKIEYDKTNPKKLIINLYMN